MLKSQIASQLFSRAMRLTRLKTFLYTDFILKFMQEQEVIINPEQAETISRSATAPSAREIEFLKEYEIKNWEFTPRIYKILLASAAFNILALFVFAQTNILQARACDSPWVGRVCQVIDTVYLGSTILSTDSDYVSKPYEKTELEDAEIVWINQTGTEPLNYPEGYFALANPESQLAEVVDPSYPTTDMPPGTFMPTSPNFPPTTTPVIPPTTSLPPQQLPPAGTNPIAIPNSPLGDNLIGKNTRKGKNRKPENNKPTGDETADNKTDESQADQKTAPNSDPVKSVELNKKPFQDLGKFVSTKWAFDPNKTDNKVELKPFQVVLNAKLTKKLVSDEDGNKREVVGFDGKASRWNEKEEAGDPEMIEIAKQAIEAVGDSGFLGHLYNLEMRELKITLTQKDDKVFITVVSAQPTEERAKTLASGLDFLIKMAKGKVKGEDEKLLLESAGTPTNNGKMFVMDVGIPKDVVQDMIIRKLADEAKKEAEKQKTNPNNSAAQTADTSLKTGK